MTEFAEAAKDIAEAFDTDLKEQVRDFDLLSTRAYDPLTRTPAARIKLASGRGVFYDDVNAKDTEVSKSSITRLVVLQHELSVKPKIDNVIQAGTDKFKIVKVSGDEVVIWDMYLEGLTE